MSDNSTLQLITTLIGFAGGFGLFIYGMHIMGEGLQKAAGNKMKELLAILTNNRFMGVIVGALVTAIIQSSSACTVMIVGFVNAGLMNLTQAVGVIMGANIGTTITSWIVSSGEWLKFLKPSTLAPLAVAVGVIMMFFSKNKRKKQIGEIIAGFGMLFIGLDSMSGSVEKYRDSQVFRDLFKNLGGNPFFGVLVGAGVTAIIQSSSASVGILQALAGMGLVPLNAAVYIILGQNIGTCVTAVFSSIGANKTAKRAAAIHLLFNIIGSLIFSIIAVIFFKFINVEIGKQSISMTNISIFHTIFNISNTVLLFPFGTLLVKLSEKFIRGNDEKDEDKGKQLLKHLDDRILETPGFAVENAIKEVVSMSKIARTNIELCRDAVINRNMEAFEKVEENEKTINSLQRVITEYLVKISNSPLNERQNVIVTGLFHTVNDIERVGDHAENIAELINNYLDKNLKFSDVALNELNGMFELILETYRDAIQSRNSYDMKKIQNVKQNEELVDEIEKQLREKHIYRLSQNICDTTSGVIFLDIISNLERVSDHSLNIVQEVEKEHM